MTESRPGPPSRDKTRQPSLLSSVGAPGVSAKFIVQTRIPLRKVGDFGSNKPNPAGFIPLRITEPQSQTPLAPAGWMIRRPKAGKDQLSTSPNGAKMKKVEALIEPPLSIQFATFFDLILKWFDLPVKDTIQVFILNLESQVVRWQRFLREEVG
jgi:hypothetical protein